LRIRFLDGETVSATVGEVSHIFNHTEMGMVNRSNGRPTAQWALLRDLAAERGFLDWSSRRADRRHQKRRERLSACLQRFFRIEGDAIQLEGNGWRTRFTIEPDC
jgi:hypothetical protein